ncbi:helix-turn-helix domain-containing protein [Mycobacterium sp. 134]|uniref:helix-turn-helix domain-containing protein n=1 Tax=Mycobacterium sp. 134 TaxID=3400425 RepID=UPI003AACD09A
MPTRPSQTDPERAELWAQRRQAVGQRIRNLRIERGLTQEALALESGVTRNVLIHVEHGKRGLLFERLYDLAEVLGIPAGDLLVDETGPKLPTKPPSSDRRELGAQ